jgi:hypothetical protein
MHYLPLPRTVLPAVTALTVCVVSWLAWGSWQDPESYWAPGDLSRYHADIGNCMSCHAPFRGVLDARCIGCHSEARFADRSLPSVSALHVEVIRQRNTCLSCHTEHRGLLGQITASTMKNPHGDFVFVATRTKSCIACHLFEPTFGMPPRLAENDTVNLLMAKGRGAHRLGGMANCQQCHAR